MPEKTNDNIPSPLRHAGTVMATQRQAPKRPSQDRNGDEKRRTASTPKVASGARAARRDRPLLQAPVKVPLGLVVQLAQATRYMPGPVWAAKVRYAVANVVLACPGAKTHPEEDLSDLMGRWHSGVRSLKTIEGVTERHHGWRHVQRVLVAMQRAENDPTLQSKLRRPNSQFLREALKRLDYELELYFQKHPECLMSPEEVAGMAPMPTDIQADWPLFQRPKAKPGIKGGVASVIEPTMAEELSCSVECAGRKRPRFSVVIAQIPKLLTKSSAPASGSVVHRKADAANRRVPNTVIVLAMAHECAASNAQQPDQFRRETLSHGVQVATKLVVLKRRASSSTRVTSCTNEETSISCWPWSLPSSAQCTGTVFKRNHLALSVHPVEVLPINTY